MDAPGVPDPTPPQSPRRKPSGSNALASVGGCPSCGRAVGGLDWSDHAGRAETKSKAARMTAIVIRIGPPRTPCDCWKDVIIPVEPRTAHDGYPHRQSLSSVALLAPESRRRYRFASSVAHWSHDSLCTGSRSARARSGIRLRCAQKPRAAGEQDTRRGSCAFDGCSRPLQLGSFG